VRADSAEQGQVRTESDDRAKHRQVRQRTDICDRPLKNERMSVDDSDDTGEYSAIKHTPGIRLDDRQLRFLRGLRHHVAE